MKIGLMILALLSLIATAAAQSGDMDIAQNLAADKFQKVPGAPECLTAAVEQGDPSKAVVFLLKATAGCSVPWHYHTANEQLMLVSGTGRVEMKDAKPVDLHAGGFAYAPAKHVHKFTCVGRPCEFFLSSDAAFDIHYVDESGSEIPPEKALAKKK